MRTYGRKERASEPADTGFSINGGNIPADMRLDVRTSHTALHPGLTFPVSEFSELELRLDPDSRALWCYMRPNGPPSFTPNMVRELNSLHKEIRSLSHSNDDKCPIDYYIMGSRIPTIYNMGGDLFYMIDTIRRGDRNSLKKYAYGCVEAVHSIWHGFDMPVESLCIVEGDALGGGLEGVVCFNTVIAERSVKMGLPEILFGSFPGMGALSFLSRRLSLREAEKMIRSGRVYSAEEMHEMGVVDFLVDKGAATQRARQYIRENRNRHTLNIALNKAKDRVAPIPIQELQDVTDLWIDTALLLSDADLRRMEIIAKAQKRRLAQTIHE